MIIANAVPYACIREHSFEDFEYKLLPPIINQCVAMSSRGLSSSAYNPLAAYILDREYWPILHPLSPDCK
jgi:hypothetical protein